MELSENDLWKIGVSKTDNNFDVSQHWEFAPNSVHYLLSPVAAFGGICPLCEGHRAPHAGDLHPWGDQGLHHVPPRVRAYHSKVEWALITVRSNKQECHMSDNTISVLCRDGLEDPLDDAGLVQQQLDQLSTIGRCEYEKTCALLVQLFDQSAQSYQELLQSTNSSTIDIAVQEGELETKPNIQINLLYHNN